MHNLQNQMINNEENMDNDITRFFSLIGEERVPGTCGNAVVTPASVQTMTGYTDGLLNKYNIFSNLGSISFEPEIMNALANVVTIAVERDMNQKFHKSLSLLEKNGIISQEKFEIHKQSVMRAKQRAGLGVYASFSIAPIISVAISNFLQKKDISEFVIGVYGYINQELSPMVRYNIVHLLAEMGINLNDAQIQSIFRKYCDKCGLSMLPFFSQRNMKVFGKTGLEILGKEIVSRCDLHSEDVRNRALEFVNQFLKLESLRTEHLVSDALESQNAVSDITWFSAINYRYIFVDFIRDVANSQQFANYDINNDPYGVLREKRRNSMESIIHDVSSQRGLFITQGKRTDIIHSSAKLMQYSLNPSYNVAVDIKMIKREKKILECYGL